MNKKILLLLIFFAVIIKSSYAQLGNQTPRVIVFLGSSTTYGMGATPIDSSFVNKLRINLRTYHRQDTIINLGVPGYTTYDIQPNNNPLNNITYALSKNPNLVIINLPTNDINNGYTDTQIINNYNNVVRLLDSANVKYIITSTQPRDFNASMRARLRPFTNLTISTYGSSKVIDYLDQLSKPDYSIRDSLEYGDGIHVNNKGHKIIYNAFINFPLYKQFVNFTQTITFSSFGTILYGAADITPGASASSGLPVTYTSSSNPAVATIVNGKVHIISAGTSVITASQGGNAQYLAAPDATQTLTVTPAVLTVTADNKTKLFGTANPALTVSYNGFVYSDTQASLTTLPAANTSATAFSPTGSYAITVSGAVNPNYTYNYVSGVLTVNPNPAPIITYSSPQSYTTGTAIPNLSPANTGGAVPPAVYSQVSTLAGSTTAGSSNGTGPTATFRTPFGVSADAAGNVYVADQGNNLIRKITPAGVVTKFAGSGTAGSANGTGTAASFKSPYGVAVDGSGNVYVADGGNNLIRKITPAGVVTTLAGTLTAGSGDGTGTGASFSNPHGICTDAAGNVYVADYTNNLIRKITPAGVVTTLAGSLTAGSVNATGTAASFRNPYSVGADALNNIYVADYGNNLIRKITPDGVVSTLAGSGAAGSVNATGTAASFRAPYGVAADGQGNVYVADGGNSQIRKITPGGVVSTLAGSTTASATNGIGTAAGFSNPRGVATDTLGNVYVADYGNNQVRKIAITGYIISPALPAGLVFDATTGTISGTPSAVSPAANYTVTAYNSYGNSTATVNIGVTAPSVILYPIITYSSPQSYTTGTAIPNLSPANTGGAVPPAVYSQVSTLAGSTTAGSSNGTGPTATFRTPFGVSADAAGNVYVADQGNNLIRKITPAGVVTKFAGSGTAGSANGTGTAASFKSPYGVAVDGSGNVYVADGGNNLIRKITPAGVVTTLAGTLTAGSGDGTGTGASFSNPHGICTDAAGNVYVADYTNNLIRKITPAGVVTTLAGSLTAGSVNATGTAASFRNPYSVGADALNNIYVADYGNNLIRKITPDGVVSTLAGSGAAGSVNATGTAASFRAPYGVAADGQGNVYVADGGNSQIRKITPGGVVSTLAGSTTASATNGIGTAAGFSNPRGVATDTLGNVYVADYGNNQVRKIAITGYIISPALPAGLVFDATTGTISGTPSAVSPAANYTVTAYNSYGNSTATVNITVTAMGGNSLAKKTLDTVSPDNAAKLAADLDPTQPNVKPALSPNGDGINDVLIIENIEKYPDNKLVLMNRAGTEIYAVNGYDNVNKVFDGHANITRSLQLPGTYFYMLEYHSKGKLKRKTGYFIIKY